LRVLLLPNNIASQIGMLVPALRALGVKARGIVRNNAAIQSGEHVENVQVVSRLRHPLRGLVQTVGWWQAVRRAIQWADVVHWISNSRVLPADLDLRYVARQGKARLVEFMGSDIRTPEVATRDNPYLARLIAAGTYRISAGASRATQRRFARRGFACLIPGPELGANLRPDLYPTYHRTEIAFDVSTLQPSYPDPARQRLLVVHVPSNQAIKGTAYVLAAVEQLQARCPFDFRLIHNIPRAEALRLVRESDIVLDQFIIGSFGSVSLEAMALGKPAVCYLTPTVRAALPADYPVVNANPDNLVEVLAALLADGPRRHDLGRRGRAYVEQYHEINQVARQLVQVYQELLDNVR
jgi:hypothetical protein